MDLSVYSRPKKAITVAVPTMREVVIPSFECALPPPKVSASTECHVTPNSIAQLMVDYALSNGCTVNDSFIDPQCGTGSLLNAMIEAGISTITGVEREFDLFNHTREKLNSSVNLVNDCFLEFASLSNQTFDAVITNPPFKKCRAHMNSAKMIVKEGGCIVALVPTSFNDPEFETLQILPVDLFPTAKVSTKLCMYFK